MKRSAEEYGRKDLCSPNRELPTTNFEELDSVIRIEFTLSDDNK